MREHNVTISAVLDEIADLLEIQGANAFRVRAYRNGARAVDELSEDVAVLLERGASLTDIPGIGSDLSNKIREIVTTGKCAYLEELRHEMSPGLADLLKLPGLGIKRVAALFHQLGIKSLDDLVEALETKRTNVLPGFGEKTRLRLLEAAQRRLAKKHAAENP